MSAKQQVEDFLRSKGFCDLRIIGDIIRQRIREGRVRIGPLKTGYYVVVQGYWLIANDLHENDQQDALSWLACAELGVPLDLRERFIAEVGPEIRNNSDFFAV